MPDGEVFTLPPDTDFAQGVAGARYTLLDGRVVESPGFTVVDTVAPPER